MKGLWAAW